MSTLLRGCRVAAVTTTVGIMLSEPWNLHICIFTNAFVEDASRNWQIMDSALLLPSSLL